MTTPATNAVAIKSALLTLIQGLPLGDVQVEYGPPANPRREFIYLGKAGGPQQPAAMRGGGAVPRLEELNIVVYIEATMLGGTGVEILKAETRAAELAGAVIAAVAEDPLLGALPGLRKIVSSGIEIDSGADDDTSRAVAVVTFTALSHLS